jgi:hypothetical protein
MGKADRAVFEGDSLKDLLDEVKSLDFLAERLRSMWLLGNRPSLDELKDWETALSRIRDRMYILVADCLKEDINVGLAPRAPAADEGTQ